MIHDDTNVRYPEKSKSLWLIETYQSRSTDKAHVKTVRLAKNHTDVPIMNFFWHYLI